MHPSVALLGGTGRSGPGLALRLAVRGVRVHIGSRDAERGETAARQVTDRLRDAGARGAGEVTGHENRRAAELGEVGVVTVPLDGVLPLLRACEPVLDGRIVVSTVVPMVYRRETGPQQVEVPEGSAAEQVAAMVPRARVVGAFHSVSHVLLADLARDIDSDVLVTGDDAGAKRTVMALAELLPGVRAVDAGPLRYARQSEALTVLLASINRVHRCHAGVVVTDLPPAQPA